MTSEERFKDCEKFSVKCPSPNCGANVVFDCSVSRIDHFSILKRKKKKRKKKYNLPFVGDFKSKNIRCMQKKVCFKLFFDCLFNLYKLFCSSWQNNFHDKYFPKTSEFVSCSWPCFFPEKGRMYFNISVLSFQDQKVKSRSNPIICTFKNILNININENYIGLF